MHATTVLTYMQTHTCTFSLSPLYRTELYTIRARFDVSVILQNIYIWSTI